MIDEPLIPPPIRCHDVSNLDLFLTVHHENKRTLRPLQHRALWDEDRVRFRIARESDLHKLPRQNDPIGIRKGDPRLACTGFRPQTRLQEIEHAFLSIDRPIHEREPSSQLVVSRMCNALRFNVPPAFQNERLRHIHDHVHGVDPMDRGQEIGLRRDQPPFIVPAAFDNAADRRGDERVVQVELGLDEVSLRPFQCRMGG